MLVLYVSIYCELIEHISCCHRSGYSGVATFCSQVATPTAGQEGLSGSVAKRTMHILSTVQCFSIGLSHEGGGVVS